MGPFSAIGAHDFGVAFRALGAWNSPLAEGANAHLIMHANDPHQRSIKDDMEQVVWGMKSQMAMYYPGMGGVVRH